MAVVIMNGKILRQFRRSYLLLGIGLFVCGCSDGGQSVAVPGDVDTRVFNWKMLTTWPANFPIFQEGAEQFAADVEAMSGGRLVIKVYAGGELAPPLQVFDAVSQGSAEMGHGASYYWSGKVPEAQFFSSVPFGMTAKGMSAWLHYGGGLELWQKAYAPFNVVPVPMGNTGVQMGGWFNKKITSLDDIKGLRMRIPGLGGKVLKLAGGSPVLLPGSEVYTALERGIIDATEWVAPLHDLRLGLNRAAKYYYYPGWHEPGTEFELIINSHNWQQLPEDLQLIVSTAATAAGQRIYAQMEFNNQQALRELMAKKNIQILEFPLEVLAELKLLADQALAEEAAKNPRFKEVHDAYKKFEADYKQWSRLADESYQKALRM